MTRNIKSLFRTICLSLIAMILLTFGACSLDHGQVSDGQLETYNIVFIFDDAEGNLVAEKVVEVAKGKTIRTSQIPLIKETLEREGYIVPESYSVYWVLLNEEKQPINLDPTAAVNNLENITSDICDNEGKVYVQTAYRKIGGAVTFFSNGGTPVQSIVGLEEGASLSEHKPADPTKVGYTFVGWFNKELTEEFNWNTTLPAEGVDLYAKWEANKETAYVVEYYFEQLDGNYKLEETEKLSAATEELVFVKALEFEGFTHNPKHAEAKLEGNVLPDGSLVLKAYYTRNEYTVSFDVDGGEEKVEQTYKYGETLEIGSTTKTGYTFLGWLLEGKELTHRTMPAQDLELVANWAVSMGIEYRIEHYFEELDGTYAKDAKVDVRSGKTGDLVSAKLREVEGFEHNADHKEAKEEAEILADGSLVLKVFYSRSEYTVSFVANGGAQKAEQTYKYGQTLELGETSKVGYTFAEWLYQGNQLVYETMPAQNLELVAKWTPNKDTAYTVEHYFEQLDGSYKLDAKVDELEGTTDAKVSAVAREVIGFTHNASHKDALETANVLPDGSLALKVYYARNTYVLTVNVDGEKEEIEYLFEEEVEALTSPEKTGYTFKAWSSAVPATMPAEDVEVVAQWTINQYTLTINVDGEKQEVVYDYNEAVETPAVPTKTGYTFKAWSPAVPATMPAEDVEVVAQWTINQYGISFDLDGGYFTTFDQFVAEIVELFANSDEPNSKVTTKETFHSNSNPNIKGVYNKAENLEAHRWLFEFVKKEINAINSESAYVIETTEMLDKMIAGDTTAIGGSYANGRTLFRHFVHNMINKNHESVNSAYTKYVPDFSLAENQEKAFAALNDVVLRFDYQENVTISIIPVKPGYAFKGWTPVAPTTMPAEDVELSATWEETVIKINYVYENGVWFDNKLPDIHYDSYEKLAEDLLADFNAYKDFDYTAESLYALGSWDAPISDVTNFFYNKNYKDKWAWIMGVIADYTSENNKNACKDFLLCSSQAELNAKNTNHIYAIAYELRGLIAGKQYTRNSSYLTADYSDAKLRQEILDYVNNNRLTSQTAYEDVTLKDLISTREEYVFEGWYTDSEFNDRVTTLTLTEGTSEYTLYAKWKLAKFYIEYDLSNSYKYDDKYVQTTFDVTRYLTYNSGGAGNALLDTAKPIYWYYIVLQETQIKGLYKIAEIVYYNYNITVDYDLVITWFDAKAAENASLANIYNNKATYVGSFVTLSGVPSELSSNCSITGTVYSPTLVEEQIVIDEYDSDYLLTESVQLPTPVLEDYIFSGWYANPEFTGSPMTSINVGSTTNYTLYAKWIAEEIVDLELSVADEAAIVASNPTIIVKPDLEPVVYRINGVKYKYGQQIFASLASALEIAKENDVIYVFAGTYAEELKFTVSNVTLAGPNYNVTAGSKSPDRNTEAIIDVVINITAASVKINGFKFTKAIKVGANNTTISNCYIVPTATVAANGVNRQGCIVDSANISDLIVQNCHIDVPGSSSNTYLKQYMSFNNVSNLTIKGNFITNSSQTQTSTSFYGMRIYTSGGFIRVIENEFRWGEVSALMNLGTKTNNCTEISIIDNYIDNNGLVSTTGGIYVNEAKSTLTVLIMGNTFKNCASKVVRLSYNYGPTVNIMYNNFGEGTPYETYDQKTAVVNFTNNYYVETQTTATSDYDVYSHDADGLAKYEADYAEYKASLVD